MPGLRVYFRENLFADIDSLRVSAGIHRKVYRNYYRALSKRFPFAIFNTISAESTPNKTSTLLCPDESTFEVLI